MESSISSKGMAGYNVSMQIHISLIDVVMNLVPAYTSILPIGVILSLMSNTFDESAIWQWTDY